MTATKAWTRRERAEALRAAFAAVPGDSSLSAVKAHVDEQHADYPWRPVWHAEIAGARMAERIRANGPNAVHPTPGARAQADSVGPVSVIPLRTDGFDPFEIQRARRFLGAIAGGSIDEARAALEFLAGFGNLSRIEFALDTWEKMLAAVGGDETSADRVLTVVAERLGNPDFPRLAVETRREAA